MRIIAIITDFGYDSPYVGPLKSQIYKIAGEEIKIIDVFHEIEKHSIYEALYWIYFLYKDYPEGTLFLCVIDPTVGTERKGIVLEFEKRFFLGPDNGIFTLLIEKGARVYELPPPPENASRTFHARDYFSIWAAKIAVSPFILKSLKKLKKPVKIKTGKPLKKAGRIIGHAVIKDKFGNLLTDIPNEWVSENKKYILKIKNFEIKGLFKTYADVPEKNLLFLRGSFGFIEIAANMESVFNIINPRLPEKIEIKEIEKI